MSHTSRTLLSFAACTVSIGASAFAAPPQYQLKILSSDASGYTLNTPRAISSSGLAVGYSWEYGKPARGWAWDGGAMRSLQPPSHMPGAWTYGLAVNSQGVIAGAIEYGGTSYAALWSGADVTLLDPITPGDSAAAAAINNSGLVTGGSFPGGIMWRNGAPSPMPLMDGAAFGSAFLVNNAGMYAGYGGRFGERAHPARWTDQGGEWLELPSQPAGAQDFVGTQLTGMNDRGDVIGWTTRYGFTGSGQLWRDGELVEIGDFDPQNPGLVVPSGINDAAWVVGFQDIPGAARGAFLWIDGEMFDLATLIENAGALDLLSAQAINNDGVILGAAFVDGRQVPVLLTPVPSPAATSLLAIAMMSAGGARRRRR